MKFPCHRKEQTLADEWCWQILIHLCYIAVILNIGQIRREAVIELNDMFICFNAVSDFWHWLVLLSVLLAMRQMITTRTWTHCMLVPWLLSTASPIWYVVPFLLDQMCRSAYDSSVHVLRSLKMCDLYFTAVYFILREIDLFYQYY